MPCAMVGDLETWARRHRHLAPAVLSGHGFRRAAWRGGGELDAEEGAGVGSPRPPSFPPSRFRTLRLVSCVRIVWVGRILAYGNDFLFFTPLHLLTARAFEPCSQTSTARER
ncbi:hypothetical protein M9H77_00268 [Catharanthus roseus]|nr:hypothetical protein M9H77_00268 [Catharanthus roseus]